MGVKDGRNADDQAAADTANPEADHSVPVQSLVSSVLNNAPPGATVYLQPQQGSLPGSLDIAALSKLPDLNVELRLMTEKGDKFVSLQELDHKLADDSTMDLATAGVVNESYNGLFDQFPKGWFTTLPTKTGLNDVRQFVKTKLAVEQLQMVDMFRAYIGTPFKEAVDAFKVMIDVYYPGLIQLLTMTREELLPLKNKIIGMNGTVPYKTDEFVNLANTNLLTIEVPQVQTELPTRTQFEQALAAVKLVFQCPHFVEFFLELEMRRLPPGTAMSVTIEDLFWFATDETIVQDLKQQLERITVMGVKAGELALQAEGLMSKPDQIAAFVISNAKTMMDFQHQLHKYSGIIRHASLLDMAIKQLVVTYLEL